MEIQSGSQVYMSFLQSLDLARQGKADPSPVKAEVVNQIKENASNQNEIDVHFQMMSHNKQKQLEFSQRTDLDIYNKPSINKINETMQARKNADAEKGKNIDLHV